MIESQRGITPQKGRARGLECVVLEGTNADECRSVYDRGCRHGWIPEYAIAGELDALQAAVVPGVQKDSALTLRESRTTSISGTYVIAHDAILRHRARPENRNAIALRIVAIAL